MFVIGGAGFIGSHLVERGGTCFDLKHGDDARNVEELIEAMRGHDAVALLASNSDLAAAALDPDLDFRSGTTIARNTLEAMRHTGIRRLVFPSGSGVYGDQGDRWLTETDIALPVSPYGASKLAAEALISAYGALGYIEPLVLRLANVTGPNLTHGVVFDFVRKLRQDPTRLAILGDGKQSKHYVHVADVVDLMTSDLMGTFNVAPDDHLSVTQIADLTCEALNVEPKVTFTGGRCGWPGDVPVIRMNCKKLRATGWAPTFNSFRAVKDALRCA